MIIRGHRILDVGFVLVVPRVASDWRGWIGTFRREDSGTRSRWHTQVANNVHGNYYSPATWEPVSSDNEVDQTEYIQELLDRPSKPLSQAPSEVTRLVPRPKGVAKPSSSSSRPSLASSSSAKASQVKFLGQILFESSSEKWSGTCDRISNTEVRGAIFQGLNISWSRIICEGICKSQVHWYVFSSGCEVLEVWRSY